MTLIFIHIPKTAGTSFRMAAEERFPDRVISDYGRVSKKTDSEIRRIFYEGEGPRGARLDAVRQWVDATNPILLAGHFNAAKYWDRFSPERFVVFLREPVERMLSEYNYLTGQGVIDMSLREYAESKPGGNKQSRKLGAVRLEQFGFVGLTERYAESIALINSQFGLDLAVKTKNKSPRLSRGVRYGDLEPATRAWLEDLNSEDYQIYAEAKALFEARLRG